MAFVFLVCLGVAVAWKWYQLSKAPSDRPLRSVTLCLTCAAASYPVAMPGGATGLDTVAYHGAAKVAQNLLLLATVYFLMCFYLYAAADERRGRRRARAEAALVLVVGTAITAAAASVPHHELAGSFATTDMTVWQVAFFYAVAACVSDVRADGRRPVDPPVRTTVHEAALDGPVGRRSGHGRYGDRLRDACRHRRRAMARSGGLRLGLALCSADPRLLEPPVRRRYHLPWRTHSAVAVSVVATTPARTRSPRTALAVDDRGRAARGTQDRLTFALGPVASAWRPP